MTDSAAETELEYFRQQWREEVSARSTRHAGSGSKTGQTLSRRGKAAVGQTPGSKRTPNVPSSTIKPSLQSDHKGNSYDPGSAYHDLENKDEYLKLGNAENRQQAFTVHREPRSALEHYEKAVERETQGNLGDSINLYRKAFRLDSNIQEKYKAKHFPATAPPSAKPPTLHSSTAAVTVPNPAHHSLHGPEPSAISTTNKPTAAGPAAAVPAKLSDLLEEFSRLDIAPAPPETDLLPPPPCPIAKIPEELLAQILTDLSLTDVANLSRVAQVCKRFAYLVMTEDSIWKQTLLHSRWGFGAMHYHYACNVKGKPLYESPFDSPSHDRLLPVYANLTPTLYPSYRTQFRNRPRVRFNGCYISTINYTRPGGASQSQFTWNSPIHIVTYYRYLRFFRDGTVISLQTTMEPADVVHHLTKENMHENHTGLLPASAVMKHALRGRWRLSGGPTLDQPKLDEIANNTSGVGNECDLGRPGEYVKEPSASDALCNGDDNAASTVLAGVDASDEQQQSAYVREEEGDVHVETEGVIPKYLYKMQFALASAGRREGTRNNKLAWKGYWNYNRLADDWAEFAMKGNRAFYWSRVNSYPL